MAKSADATPLPSLIKKIDGLNHNKKIKLRYKPTQKKGFSLYLDLWQDEKRVYQFLKVYVSGNKSSFAEDKEKLRIAAAMRDKKEIELLEQQSGFALTDHRQKASFLDYFEKLCVMKKHRNWTSSLNHLRTFSGSSLSFNQIDRRFAERYRDYLLSVVENNSAYSYWAKFKAALNIAVKDGILSENPASKITISYRDTTREFLTEEEIKMAIDTPSSDLEVKNAFIFACFTGLRISDIQQLTFNQTQNGYLYFRQQKTDGLERIKIHGKAEDILNQQKELRSNSETDRVFLLPLTSDTINKVIRRWIKDAGINKKITFHCSRHTFATLCLTFDVDIFTVSKLLGHKDLKTTQVYAKLIDKKKDEAIDKLPEI